MPIYANNRLRKIGAQQLVHWRQRDLRRIATRRGSTSSGPSALAKAIITTEITRCGNEPSSRRRARFRECPAAGPEHKGRHRPDADDAWQTSGRKAASDSGEAPDDRKEVT